MPIKCQCPNECKLHDLCDCGASKQVYSLECKKCFQTKLCTRCSERKLKSLFSRNKSSKDGFRTICKECSKTSCVCGALKEPQSRYCLDCSRDKISSKLSLIHI